SCIAGCPRPKSASSSSSARTTPTSSCPPCKPSGRSSTAWASASALSSRVAPKKSEGDRRDLRELAASPSASGLLPDDPARVFRRQGAGPDRPVLAWRQEPGWQEGGRPRLQGEGQVHPLRDLPAGLQGPEPVLHGLEGDQRLHRGPIGPMVA